MAHPDPTVIEFHPFTGDRHHQHQTQGHRRQHQGPQRFGGHQRQGQHQGQIEGQQGEADQWSHGVDALLR